MNLLHPSIKLQPVYEVGESVKYCWLSEEPNVSGAQWQHASDAVNPWIPIELPPRVGQPIVSFSSYWRIKKWGQEWQNQNESIHRNPNQTRNSTRCLTHALIELQQMESQNEWMNWWLSNNQKDVENSDDEGLTTHFHQHQSNPLGGQSHILDSGNMRSMLIFRQLPRNHRHTHDNRRCHDFRTEGVRWKKNE